MSDRAAKIEAQMRENPAGVKFTDLLWLCTELFGKPRNKGTSHHIFKMPWPGDPRVNIQAQKGNAKAYQAKQVLAAIDKIGKEAQ